MTISDNRVIIKKINKVILKGFKLNNNDDTSDK